MTATDLARQRRQNRRVLTACAVALALVVLAGLWVPVANTYQAELTGNATSTHHFGLLRYAELSWSGPTDQWIWPVSQLRPEVNWQRTYWTLLASLFLFTPLVWVRVQIVRRQKRYLFTVRKR